MDKSCLTPVIGSLLLVLLSSPAARASEPGVAPFTLAYSFSGSGVPFSISAERTLKPVGDGQWEMQIRARNMLGEIRETTRFSWTEECLPQSLYYGNYRRGLGRERQATLTLDQRTGLATLTRNGEFSREFEIDADTTDILSQTLALQCLLQRGESGATTLDVASERRREPMTYQRLGEERVRTAAGRFNAVKLERVRDDDSGRRTLLWFAPELDYTLVRMIQDNGDDEYELELKRR
ncbi:DUF3108 domain-containing protein [Isoalcanivorax pacificus]|nr:DUF3108 domain-containing protein [Isoalcanivorax pacificus]